MAQLNHIGIAVADLAGMKKLFSLLGLMVNHEEPVPDQGVVTHFLPTSSDNVAESHLELLEVTDPQGTVAQFIKKRGPGIHHLAFQVTSGKLGPLCRELRNAGYRLVYEEPKAGAHGMSVNFLHPATAGGILIELIEPRAD